MRDRPFARLTRHFFDSLFEFDVLSEAGVEAFERLIVGICVVFLSIDLILARLVAAKYAYISAALDPALLAPAILADHALVLGLPMWTGALVAALVGHAVFPDERDFRILMALPVPQRLVFGAKIAALALFAGVFIATIHVFLSPVLVAVIVSRPPGISVLATIGSFAGATVAASSFSLLSVMGLNGLLMLTARDRLLSASAAFRSLMLVVLVVLFPFVWQLSAMASPIARSAWWLFLVPPAWFVGLEQLLAGNSTLLMLRLGVLAVAAWAGAALTVAATYAILYRRFDRVMVRPSHGTSPQGDHVRRQLPQRERTVSQRGLAAVQTFTFVTLRRSVLHQGIVVALGGMGLGVVINGFISLAEGDALLGTTIWAPFVMIFALCSALRLSLSVPIEPRANWIFRMAERQSTRVHQLRAPVRVMVTLGVAVPVLALLPYQWLLLGPSALAAAAVTFAVGLLFVEVLMKQWARIPFTCSYIPGKGFVPQMLLTTFVVYVLLTTGGAALVRYTLTGRRGALVPLAAVAIMTLWFRHRRTERSKATSLLFEDELPTEVNQLRLSD